MQARRRFELRGEGIGRTDEQKESRDGQPPWMRLHRSVRPSIGLRHEVLVHESEPLVPAWIVEELCFAGADAEEVVLQRREQLLVLRVVRLIEARLARADLGLFAVPR